MMMQFCEVEIRFDCYVFFGEECAGDGAKITFMKNTNTFNFDLSSNFNGFEILGKESC